MTREYWQEEIETLSPKKLKELQLKRLKNTLQRALQSPFYKKVDQQTSLSVENIHYIEDIQKLPFTTKQDLRASYPFGLATSNPKENGVRIHCSSGTTGNPTLIAYSKQDIDNWANLVARSLYMVGVRNTDVFQNSSGYGMFTGGLGFQYGAERLGALTVPAAAGNSKRQVKFITDFQTTTLHAIPSYAVRLAEVFQEEGLDPLQSS
ncbi:MAG: phenylacetate--CoA ligase, partial [Bacteroidaceae bacterium]